MNESSHTQRRQPGRLFFSEESQRRIGRQRFCDRFQCINKQMKFNWTSFHGSRTLERLLATRASLRTKTMAWKRMCSRPKSFWENTCMNTYQCSAIRLLWTIQVSLACVIIVSWWPLAQGLQQQEKRLDCLGGQPHRWRRIQPRPDW